MTGIRDTITIDDKDVNAALRRVEEAGGDTTALMRQIADTMLFGVQRRFETETDPDGSKWPAHASRTAKARANRKTRGNAPITPRLLRDSGRLFKSITGEASSTEAAVGTNLVYGAIHQLGGVITQAPRTQTIRFRKVGGRTRFAKKAHKRATDRQVSIGQRRIVIPARRYLGFSEEDRQRMLKIAEAFYSDLVDGSDRGRIPGGRP